MGKEQHRYGTERLSSGITMQRLSADQLGRRMAMKRQGKAGMGNGLARLRMAAAVRRYAKAWRSNAENGKGIDVLG